jgi:hypothetical protein
MQKIALQAIWKLVKNILVKDSNKEVRDSNKEVKDSHKVVKDSNRVDKDSHKVVKDCNKEVKDSYKEVKGNSKEDKDSHKVVKASNKVAKAKLEVEGVIIKAAKAWVTEIISKGGGYKSARASAIIIKVKGEVHWAASKKIIIKRITSQVQPTTVLIMKQLGKERQEEAITSRQALERRLKAITRKEQERRKETNQERRMEDPDTRNCCLRAGSSIPASPTKQLLARRKLSSKYDICIYCTVFVNMFCKSKMSYLFPNST